MRGCRPLQVYEVVEVARSFGGRYQLAGLCVVSRRALYGLSHHGTLKPALARLSAAWPDRRLVDSHSTAYEKETSGPYCCPASACTGRPLAGVSRRPACYGEPVHFSITYPYNATLTLRPTLLTENRGFEVVRDKGKKRLLRP